MTVHGLKLFVFFNLNPRFLRQCWFFSYIFIVASPVFQTPLMTWYISLALSLTTLTGISAVWDSADKTSGVSEIMLIFQKVFVAASAVPEISWRCISCVSDTTDLCSFLNIFQNLKLKKNRLTALESIWDWIMRKLAVKNLVMLCFIIKIHFIKVIYTACTLVKI